MTQTVTQTSPLYSLPGCRGLRVRYLCTVCYIAVILMVVLAPALVTAGKRKAVVADLVDSHEDCEFWASVGECTKNAGT